MAVVQCLSCEAIWEVSDSVVPDGVEKWDTFSCEGACRYCQEGPNVALLEK